MCTEISRIFRFSKNSGNSKTEFQVIRPTEFWNIFNKNQKYHVTCCHVINKINLHYIFEKIDKVEEIIF